MNLDLIFYFASENFISVKYNGVLNFRGVVLFTFYFLLNSRVRVGAGEGGESLKFEVQLGFPVGVRRVDHFSFLF